MKLCSTLLAALALATPAFFAAPVQAGILHKHPVITGIAAGVAAHHLAKKHGHGVLHHHPVMTGIAAGVAAHHLAKTHHKL
jgi:hypothetical protein